MKIYPLPFAALASTILLVVFVGLLAHTIRTYNTFQVPSKHFLLYSNSSGLTLFDRHGNKFFSFDTPGNHTVVPYSSIPTHLIQALIAAEDRTFFDHHGISLTGIARAAYIDLRLGRLLYGGSTITQQLTKTVLLNPRKSLTRKYQEAVYALKIDRHFSKEDILEMYLNNVYFGERAYGIEAAARTYFDKTAAELTVAESAMLIGILPAPTAFSPISGDSNAARIRQHRTLQQMLEEKFLTADQVQQAKEQTLAYAQAPPPSNEFAHHFALAVHQQLVEKFTKEYVNHTGMNVYTTLDPGWQRQAEASLAEHVTALQKLNASNGALVMLDVETREVRALVGSLNWHNQEFGKMNMALAPRQTGSAFKPIVYAAALESQQLNTASFLLDQPMTFGKDFRPQNYDKRYRGRVTVRYALANSLNIPAVALTDRLGPRNVVAAAKKLGVSSLSREAESNLSIALGTEEISLLELTNAYAAFADKGRHAPPQFILRIADKFGRSIDWDQPSKQQVLSAETAFLVTSILSDNDIRRRTFGNTLVTNIPSASKTGTTQDFRDAWTVGYTPHLAIGVWTGNNNFTPMHNAPGATASAPLWRSLVNTFAASYQPASFEVPTAIVRRHICPRYGLLATKDSVGIPEYFISGTEPTRYCPDPEPSPDPDNPDDPKHTAPPEVAAIQPLTSVE